mgnify:CR=1 FL=1
MPLLRSPHSPNLSLPKPQSLRRRPRLCSRNIMALLLALLREAEVPCDVQRVILSVEMLVNRQMIEAFLEKLKGKPLSRELRYTGEGLDLELRRADDVQINGGRALGLSRGLGARPGPDGLDQTEGGQDGHRLGGGALMGIRRLVGSVCGGHRVFSFQRAKILNSSAGRY